MPRLFSGPPLSPPELELRVMFHYCWVYVEILVPYMVSIDPAGGVTPGKDEIPGSLL